MVDNTFETIKSSAKEAAKKVTDSHTYLGSKDKKEDGEFPGGDKEPMNPEDITARTYCYQER